LFQRASTNLRNITGESNWRRLRNHTKLRYYPCTLADDVTGEQTGSAFPRRRLGCDGGAAPSGEERRSYLGHGWAGVEEQSTPLPHAHHMIW